jgi:hypothetical protein
MMGGPAASHPAADAADDATHRVATTAELKQGRHVVIAGSVSDAVDLSICTDALRAGALVTAAW